MVFKVYTKIIFTKNAPLIGDYKIYFVDNIRYLWRNALSKYLILFPVKSFIVKCIENV